MKCGVIKRPHVMYNEEEECDQFQEMVKEH